MNVVIGIGNEYRRDDGFGPAVIAALQQDPPADTRLVVSDGEPSTLLAAWQGADLAMLVDAVQCEPAQPGRIHRTDLAGLRETAYPTTGSGHSSHGLGLPEAIELGAALGKLPNRLIVLAVEAADLDFGTGLSAPVNAALPKVVAQVKMILNA